MKHFLLSVLTMLLLTLMAPVTAIEKQEAIHFVLQLTRSGENYGHRRVFLQMDKILNDLSDKSIKIEVVAYEDGIQALLSNNKETSQLLTKLANRGVTFKACRISMRAWKLKEDDFPLEVDFIPSGAPHMIKRQMEGYKYWRP